MKGNIVLGILYVLLAIAAVLGIYSQSFAYMFTDFAPYQVLIVVIVISTALFFVTFLTGLLILLKQKVKRNANFGYMILNFFIGFSVTMWSLFVLIMWMG